MFPWRKEKTYQHFLLEKRNSFPGTKCQLLSNYRSRGLIQLIRARNIHTIGHLAALTETEIDSLPIKAPKVQTVRKVLASFGGTLQAKKSKLGRSPKVEFQAGKMEGKS